jgi:hypothetical protein
VDPIRNPYSPGAGSRPPALAGRDAELQAFRILLERLRRGRPEKSMIVTGLRGVGKTVLLNTFGSIAEEAKFATAFTEITHETEFRPLMARLIRRTLLSLSPLDRMKERARRAVAVLKAFTLKLPDGPRSHRRGGAGVMATSVRTSRTCSWRSVARLPSMTRESFSSSTRSSSSSARSSRR